MNLPPIALASSSPRRLQLLQSLDLEVRQLDVAHKEMIDPSWTVSEIPSRLAHSKNLSIRGLQTPTEVLLTADTVVILEDQILHKPENTEEARSMLRMLSNRWHEVVTGVCIYGEREIVFSDRTRVHMTRLSGEAIDYYIHTCQPFDKAGSYGIQEWIGWSHIDRIEGSFSNVMGLPTNQVFHTLIANFQPQ